MCMASMLDKIRLHNPLARKLEEKTGIRPHGLGFMMGKRDGNLFYKKGGAGYAGDPGSNLTRPVRTHHIQTIAAAKARQGGV